MPRKAITHFRKVDPKLATFIESLKNKKNLKPETQRDLFESLCRSIVGQQLSGKAARSIWYRVIELFPRKRASAKVILALTDAQLRSCGLSGAKTRALQDLSEHVVSKKLNLMKIKDLPEDEVREQLIQVRGIGPWTAEMFLMFSLGKEDVFSPGDLGLRKGMQKLYKLKALPEPKDASKRAEKWAPYRTYASCALWRIVDDRDWD